MVFTPHGAMSTASTAYQVQNRIYSILETSELGQILGKDNPSVMTCFALIGWGTSQGETPEQVLEKIRNYAKGDPMMIASLPFAVEQPCSVEQMYGMISAF